MIYVVLIGSTLLLGCITSLIHKNAVKDIRYKIGFGFWGMLTILPMALLSGLRDYSIGTDTSATYYSIYRQVANGRAYNIRDFGYAILNKVAIFFRNDYTSVLLLTSFIICGLAGYIIFRDSKQPIMSLLLFFTTNVYFISMNMIRQSIATMIFILAIPCIRERKIWRYMVLIAIASAIHAIAIIYFPIYFLFQIRLNKSRVLAGGTLTVVLASVLQVIIIRFVQNIGFFSRYFAKYINSSFDSGNVNWISLLVSAAILIFMLYIYRWAKDDSNYRIMLWLSFITAVILILSARIPLAQRISWLFSFANFVYLPGMISFIPNRNNRKIIGFAINLGYLGYMFGTVFVRGYQEVYPYVSILTTRR